MVLSEGIEPRTIQAAKGIIAEKIANVILLGNQDEISKLAKKYGLKLDKVQVMDPMASELLPSFAEEFYGLRKEKGITEQEAIDTMRKYLFFGAMLVRREAAVRRSGRIDQYDRGCSAGGDSGDRSGAGDKDGIGGVHDDGAEVSG